MSELTRNEKETIRAAGVVMLRFAALPQCHPADLKDVEFHVHAIQNVVMSRAAVRADLDDYNHVEGFE